jgi:hypothetical protein
MKLDKIFSEVRVLELRIHVHLAKLYFGFTETRFIWICWGDDHIKWEGPLEWPFFLLFVNQHVV